MDNTIPNDIIMNALPSYYSVSNVTFVGEGYSSVASARTSGLGGADGILRLSGKHQIENSFSANVGVSAPAVNATVSFDVTSSVSRTAVHEIETNGNAYQIDGYTAYNNYAFDVSNIFGVNAGSGNTLQAIGFCYTTYQI
ncbi:hypothetical protein [Salinicoccus sesuvii]